MTVELRRPDERTCEVCGRREAWDGAADAWTVEEVGNVYCLHEWDINGDFLPFEEPDDGAGTA